MIIDRPSKLEVKERGQRLRVFHYIVTLRLNILESKNPFLKLLTPKVKFSQDKKLIIKCQTSKFDC